MEEKKKYLLYITLKSSTYKEFSEIVEYTLEV